MKLWRRAEVEAELNIRSVRANVEISAAAAIVVRSAKPRALHVL